MRIPVFLLLAAGRPVAAQTARLDDLHRLLNPATTDTARATLDARKVAEPSRNHPDSAFAPGKRAQFVVRRPARPTTLIPPQRPPLDP